MRVDENIASDKMKCLVETARSTFPRAKICLSAVLPGRNNKNRVNIDKYNEVMKRVCNETGAEFVNFTAKFENAPGRPNKEMYRDEVHPNSRGVHALVSLLLVKIFLNEKKNHVFCTHRLNTHFFQIFSYNVYDKLRSMYTLDYSIEYQHFTEFFG